MEYGKESSDLLVAISNHKHLQEGRKRVLSMHQARDDGAVPENHGLGPSASKLTVDLKGIVANGSRVSDRQSRVGMSYPRVTDQLRGRRQRR